LLYSGTPDKVNSASYP